MIIDLQEVKNTVRRVPITFHQVSHNIISCVSIAQCQNKECVYIVLCHFVKCVDCYIHHYNQDTELFHHHKCLLVLSFGQFA